MFDPKFYRFLNEELRSKNDQTLEQHFNTIGWKEGRDPNAFFSVTAYHDANPDVAAENGNPFSHYQSFGKAEGREAKLSDWGVKQEQVVTADHISAAMPWIDAEHLRSIRPTLEGMDDLTVVAWFMALGWREMVNPSDRFDTAYYLEENDDVAEHSINPLLHFIEFGQLEGRFATAEQAAVYSSSFEEADEDIEGPSAEEVESSGREAEVEQEAEKSQLHADLEAVRQAFNPEFYRSAYSDIEGDDDALLRHYMTEGWKEGRNPSPEFHTSFYLQRHTDLTDTGVNPLLHYVLFGRYEGRACSPGGPVKLLLDKSVSLSPDLPKMALTHFDGKAARPPQSIDCGALNVNWIVPDFRAGSGGHMTIFRIVRYLELFGHRNTIWIEKPVFHDTESEAWETIVKSFQCVEAQVRFVSDEIYQTSGDVVIATGWSTAFTAKQLGGFKARMYFVQDHEPEFYPTGSSSNLAKLTYGFGLGCICASPWLEQLMSTKYGQWARGFSLAYEPDQYFVKSDTKENNTASRPLKIAVYGRAHTDRRCVQLALAGLEILSRDRDDFEVHFFGQDEMQFNTAPFPAFNHGVLSAAELNDLYNACDIGICFSGTNYSLVPQEMMACGLPLIEFNTESTQVIFPKDTVTLAGPDPSDISKKISRLMDSPASREKQRKAALKWVAGFSWRQSARTVETAILDFLQDQGAKLSTPSVAKEKNILLDVVVPTWNGREEFGPVLDALRGQHLADQVQIHCVDSSSSDGTIEWLRDQADVSLTVIDQKDFQHGRTRNFGASLGSAPFIGFITQDAMPATQHWATDIVKMMRAVPDAAGLFGRHIGYPDHPFFVRQEMTTHFQNMMKFPLVLSKHTDPERWESGDIGWRQFLHFYSDNNSAMRRAVWNEIPYPEVNYGEDQVWARDIIEAGYSKIYAPTATVYHSHDYDPEQTYKRSKTEGAFFYEYFGYELGEGSEEVIAQRVASEQRNMEAWGHSNGIGAEEIEMRKANIAEKYRGWRDGRAQAMAGGGVIA